MTYRAPVADIAFTLKHAAGLKAALAEGLYGDLDEETVDSVIAEAGRYATDVVTVMRQGSVVATLPTADTTPEQLAELMVGRKVLLRVDKTASRPGATVAYRHTEVAMNPSLPWLAVALAACITSGPAGAQALTAPAALSAHDRVVEHLQRLGEAELKRVVLRCNRAATQRVLDFSEAAMCSLASETLLQRVFHGDFDALLAWHRQLAEAD